MSRGGYRGDPTPSGLPPKPDAFIQRQRIAYGCSVCGRQFWPKPTQAVKNRVPIHDFYGGPCDGSICPPVILERDQ